MQHTARSPRGTQEQLGIIEHTPKEDIPTIVEKSKAAFLHRSAYSIEERAVYIKDFLVSYSQQKEHLARLISYEIGKPITQALGDVDYDLGYIQRYIDHTKETLQSTVIHEDDTTLHTLYYEPKGVAVSISPRNYPTSQFTWQVIPALLAGNTVIYKPSHLCIRTGQAISELLATCLPQHVFIPVYGEAEVGEALVASDADFIIFTGSPQTGKKISLTAAQGLKKTFLELGGSAPGIILPDAKIDQEMMKMISYSRRRHAGQICDWLKRMFVHQSRIDQFLATITTYLQVKKVWNPLDPDTHVGCIVSQSQFELIQSQLADAKQKGATLIELGQYDGTPGPFLKPTLVLHPTMEMRVMREEVFWPVLPIMSYETVDEAIELANDTDYGLGGYLRGEDVEQLKYVCSKLKTGNIAVNNTSYLLPQIPFGGYKNMSGNCREHGRMGLREYCEVKVVSRRKDSRR